MGNLINNTELLLKTLDNQIDKEVEFIRKHAKYHIREAIEAGIIKQHPRLADYNCTLLPAIMVDLAEKNTTLIGMDKHFMRTHFNPIKKEIEEAVYKKNK